MTTTESIPGKEYEVLGIVKGSVVQSKSIGRDILAGLKNMVGGEIREYTEMMNEARAIATKRMTEEAQAMGANAIVAVRYASSQTMEAASEVIAYGTAVKIKSY